jgi:hypothetical protein
MENPHTRAPVQRPMPTGPVSRLARVVLAGVVGAGVYGLLGTGMANFSDPEILAQPGFWLITIIAVQNLYGIPQHLSGPAWGRRVLVGFFAVAAAAAVVATVGAGTPWAAPLTWLLYLMELVVFTLVGLAFAISALLGRPGCELDALRELLVRVHGTVDLEDAEAAWCLVGLHRLDAWEERQPWRRGGGRA